MTRRTIVPRAFLMLGATLLVGCSASQAPEYVPARSWLISGEDEVPGYGAYGYLVLTDRPSGQDVRRQVTVCEAFKRRLAPTDAHVDVDPRSLMVTHWLLTRPASDPEPCAELVAQYDYARAARIASAVGKAGTTGPLLTAWSTPFASRSASANALVWDMSRYDDADLDRAVRMWIDLFARDPTLWRDGKYKVVRIREELRNAVLAYDDVTLAVITSFLPGQRESTDRPPAAEPGG